MNAFIPIELIEAQVLEAMREAGIPPLRDTRLVIDGALHRYAVEGDKGRETAGAYVIYPDGVPGGYISSWRHGVEVRWKFDLEPLDADLYKRCRSPEFRKQAEAAQRKRDADRRKAQTVASEDARIRWEAAQTVPEDHEYLRRKNVPAYGLKCREGALLIPLRDIEGHFKTFQTIAPDGTKRYFPGAPVGGGFCAIGEDVKDGPVLLCEGYATGATLHELTGHAVICAMNCHNLVTCAPALRKKYPDRKIIVMADDDAKTEGNPGITAAQSAVKQGKLDGVLKPPFKTPEDGTDWNDFSHRYGAEAAERVLKERLAWACMSEAERKDCARKTALSKLRCSLDETVRLDPVEMVGGLFPKGYLSAIIAAPGVGKTWFVQKFVSDLSVGGQIFDGVEYSKPKKSLIFAGEAGYETLIRRAAETKWPVDKTNVQIYSSIEAGLKGFSFDIGTPEGQENLKYALELDEPEIVFFDTLTSFHSADENKAVEMKPIFEHLLSVARQRNMAIVLVHHTRKRKLAEQKFMMTQDESIGSSVLNRLVAVVLGIEPIDGPDDENNSGENKTNLVKVQKSWFRKTPSFSYKLEENDDGRTVMRVDLEPKIGGGARAQIWDYIERTYEPGVWFKASDVREVAKTGVTYTRRCLSDWVEKGKLKQRGVKRGAEYALVGFYAQAISELSQQP